MLSSIDDIDDIDDSWTHLRRQPTDDCPIIRHGPFDDCPRPPDCPSIRHFIRTSSSMDVQKSNCDDPDIDSLTYSSCPRPGLSLESDSQMRNQQVQEESQSIRSSFIAEYGNVANHEIYHRVQGRFHNWIRAWGFGLVALRQVSRGYLPHGLDMTVALLCVCKAVSHTLDKYSDMPYYVRQFEKDVSRWFTLFRGKDRSLLQDLALSVWGVAWAERDSWHRPSSPATDYGDLLQRAQGIVSDLANAAERLLEAASFDGQGPLENGGGLPRPSPPMTNDGELADTGQGTWGSQHRKAVVDERMPSQKSQLLVGVLAGAIFMIILIFLVCK